MNLYDFFSNKKINLTENLVSASDVEKQVINENLHKWFKEKWVRFGPDGKIRGDCARGDDSEGKPKCLPQSKAHSLGKKGRASAASRKRREDPNPERRGAAINVATKKESISEEAFYEKLIMLEYKLAEAGKASAMGTSQTARDTRADLRATSVNPPTASAPVTTTTTPRRGAMPRAGTPGAYYVANEPTPTPPAPRPPGTTASGVVRPAPTTGVSTDLPSKLSGGGSDNDYSRSPKSDTTLPLPSSAVVTSPMPRTTPSDNRPAVQATSLPPVGREPSSVTKPTDDQLAAAAELATGGYSGGKKTEPTASTTTTSTPPPSSSYTIQRGDTLSQIAKKFGTTTQELMRLNPDIKDPNKIVAGKPLNTPGVTPYPSDSGVRVGQAPTIDDETRERARLSVAPDQSDAETARLNRQPRKISPDSVGTEFGGQLQTTDGTPVKTGSSTKSDEPPAVKPSVAPDQSDAETARLNRPPIKPSDDKKTEPTDDELAAAAELATGGYSGGKKTEPTSPFPDSAPAKLPPTLNLPPPSKDVRYVPNGQENLQKLHAELMSQGITDPKYLTAIIATAYKEGQGGVRPETSYSNTDTARIFKVFSDLNTHPYFKKNKMSQDQQYEYIEKLKKDPEEFFNFIYSPGFRKGLGNTEPGDGYKFRGRGNIGLTGKSNYAAASRDLYGDDRLVRNPDLISKDPEVSRKVTAWYMKDNQDRMLGRMGAQQLGLIEPNGSTVDIDAVKQFQRDNNLTADGKIGPATRKKILQLTGLNINNLTDEQAVRLATSTVAGRLIDPNEETTNGKGYQEALRFYRAASGSPSRPAPAGAPGSRPPVSGSPPRPAPAGPPVRGSPSRQAPAGAPGSRPPVKENFQFSPEQEKWLGGANRKDPSILARMPGPKPPPEYFNNSDDQKIAQQIAKSQELADKWQQFRQGGSLLSKALRRVPGVNQAANVVDVGANVVKGDFATAGKQALGMIPAAKPLNVALQAGDVIGNVKKGDYASGLRGALGLAAGQGNETAAKAVKGLSTFDKIKNASQKISNFTNKEQTMENTCPHCGGIALDNEILAEKKDACYHKVKSRYKVWPSAYASGALVKCRKKGAKNWGKSKTNEDTNLYFNVVGTDKKTLISEFKLQHNARGWYLNENSPSSLKLDAVRAFGMPLSEEELNPIAYDGTAATIGTDNGKSPVGSIPKSQRINKRRGKV